METNNKKKCLFNGNLPYEQKIAGNTKQKIFEMDWIGMFVTVLFLSKEYVINYL